MQWVGLDMVGLFTAKQILLFLMEPVLCSPQVKLRYNKVTTEFPIKPCNKFDYENSQKKKCY